MAYPALIIVIIVGKRNWNDLKKFIVTAGIYQYGIGSEYTTKETLDRFSRSIEQNDWPTAKQWALQIEKEIRTKKGKKEQIIEAVQQIFRPLYVENMSIESTMSSMIKSGNSVPLPIGEWNSIQSDPKSVSRDRRCHAGRISLRARTSQADSIHGCAIGHSLIKKTICPAIIKVPIKDKNICYLVRIP